MEAALWHHITQYTERAFFLAPLFCLPLFLSAFCCRCLLLLAPPAFLAACLCLFDRFGPVAQQLLVCPMQLNSSTLPPVCFELCIAGRSQPKKSMAIAVSRPLAQVQKDSAGVRFAWQEEAGRGGGGEEGGKSD